MFVAAGFCAHGLAGAGGIGKVIAEWIAEGEPSLDLWEMDVRRFGAQYRSPAYTHARIRETYETYYDIRYPNHERSAGRPLRVSAANAWHASTAPPSARSRAGSGSTGTSPTPPPGTSRCARAAGRASTGRPRSAPSTARPARRSRSSTSRSFAKLEIEGPGAAELLERLCDNRVAREVGRITYTQMLNRRGGIECDFTVARLAEERFSIVTGTAFGNHDREWIRKHLPEDGSATGPRRHLGLVVLRGLGAAGARAARAADPGRSLQRGFPYMSRARDHGRQRPGAGACGSPTSASSAGSSTARPSTGSASGGRSGRPGEPHGIVAGGYRAIDSMRLEKGYRVWGADITPDETPYEGGVGFCVKLDKEGGFIGREALARRRSAARGRGSAA